MTSEPTPSAFRVEKQRADATVTLASGPTIRGCFFVAGGSPHQAGPERVGDLLNSESGFFPFETEEAGGIRTMLCNRSQVVMVALADNEATRDSGYDVATRRVVSMLLSNGQRVAGAVRVYRPMGRDRLSDWARQPETFRYVETDEATLLVNAAHIIEVTEISE